MRWICSQRTRLGDIGFSGGSIFLLSVASKAGDIIGVDRLGEIIDRAKLHRVHRGCDIAVAGEDDRAHFGSALLNGLVSGTLSTVSKWCFAVFIIR
jgi:hypothetical protein